MNIGSACFLPCFQRSILTILSTLPFQGLLPQSEHRISLFPPLLSAIDQTPFVLLFVFSYWFKDQASTDIVPAQLKDLIQKIQMTLQSVFVSQKNGEEEETKPPIVNQHVQCQIQFTNLNVPCAMQVLLV